MLTTVAAVVVHHRSYETVRAVVETLLHEGVLPESMVLVDNSEEPTLREQLRDLIPNSVVILFEENRGYGAAVNAGIDYFAHRAGHNPEFLLVSTHETRPERGALRSLLQALSDDSAAAVAGPTLLSGNEPEFVWSAGGYLAPLSHIPSHYHHRAPLAVLENETKPIPRAWLDGAFLLYRWADIHQMRSPERFFLYMEETDLHLNLGKAGRKVVWVPSARVWQDSNGIPPFYLARNLRLLFQGHENYLRRATVVPFAVMRRIVSNAIKRGDFSGIRPSLRGLMVKLPTEDGLSSKRRVFIVNPLGAALRHYESELESVLSEHDAGVTITRIMEPSASGRSSILWLWDYIVGLLRVQRTSRGAGMRIIVIWPVLGYWDVLIFRMLRIPRVTLVIHDPHPLVKAVGYSSLARKFASFFAGKMDVLVHSQKALDVIGREAPRLSVSHLPHPILNPSVSVFSDALEKPVVRVVGQYKPDRDLEALAQIGRALQEMATLEIHGRGWPDIDGWEVSRGFVPEERLTELIGQSSVIVIPYKNFFQSGIAIRSLELGVPFVGPKASVLAEMLGHESSLLVDDGGSDSWVSSVRHGISLGSKDAADAARGWRSHNMQAWATWLGRSSRRTTAASER